MNANYYIDKLNLTRHPEGGYYNEIYRSNKTITIEEKERNLGTSIYFLLKSKEVSVFHRLKSDEIFNFHDGSSMKIHILSETKGMKSYNLGLNIENGEKPQIVISSGSIFGAEVNNSNSYSLIGCTVFPGFHFEDFEMVERTYLLKKYPEYEKLIIKLTK